MTRLTWQEKTLRFNKLVASYRRCVCLIINRRISFFSGQEEHSCDLPANRWRIHSSISKPLLICFVYDIQQEKMYAHKRGLRFPPSRYTQKVPLRYSSPETNTREWDNEEIIVFYEVKISQIQNYVYYTSYNIAYVCVLYNLF